ETKHLIQRDQCDWLRCLFPNPLSDSAIHPDWLTSTVTDLTRGIVTDSAFDRLPILADALQDAGCDNEHLLHHCRHAEYHGQHCWAVSALAEAVGFTAWHWVTTRGT
ncbi:MAG: hypothetical protein K2V38_24935, partial [Gemmataceae bacterium]|nr:hypothetical protein [Gemmataceae bacterium]